MSTSVELLDAWGDMPEDLSMYIVYGDIQELQRQLNCGETFLEVRRRLYDWAECNKYEQSCECSEAARFDVDH